MFRASSAHLQEDTVVYMQHMVVGGCLKTPTNQPSPYSQFLLKLCTDRPPQTLVESDSIICCMYTTYPPEDEHLRLETCRGK